MLGLLLVSLVLRGMSVDRAPLGNLFEFSVVGCLFAVGTYSVVSLRRDVRWGLGLTALIGIPGIALYLGAVALGLNTTVEAFVLPVLL